MTGAALAIRNLGRVASHKVSSFDLSNCDLSAMSTVSSDTGIIPILGRMTIVSVGGGHFFGGDGARGFEACEAAIDIAL